MSVSDETDGYQTYVVRLWRVRRQGEWEWRASLESRHTGEHHLFASVEQLYAFLYARCEDLEPGAAETPVARPD